MTATGIAGNAVQVRFTALAGTGTTPGKATALDNVFITETTLPTLVSVSSSKPDATYTAADVIDISLNFSEVVSSIGLVLNLQ